VDLGLELSVNPWSIGTHTPCLLSRKCPTTKQKGKLKNDHSIYFTFAAVYNSNKKKYGSLLNTITLKPCDKNAYSPYCSPYTSYGTSKEN